MNKVFLRFDEIPEDLSVHFQQKVTWFENADALSTLPNTGM